MITGQDVAGTYASKVEGDASKGLVITNTHTPEKITIKGTKIWKDNNDESGKRPDHITLRLKVDGSDLKTLTVSDPSGASGEGSSEWPWQFTDVPGYEEGEPISYTITEDSIDHYIGDISGDAVAGFMITNTYKEGKTHVNVSKVWDDGNNQDGI